MSKFLTAVGVGITAYFILTHQPTWLIVLSVVGDIWAILGHIKD